MPAFLPIFTSSKSRLATDLHLRKGGFTLLEGLLALWVNSLTLLFLLILLQSIPPILQSQSNDPLFDEHWFINHVQDNLQTMKIVSVRPNVLKLNDPVEGAYTMYERYRNNDGLMLRKRKRNVGHVVLLTHLKGITWSSIQEGADPIVELELVYPQFRRKYWLFASP